MCNTGLIVKINYAGTDSVDYSNLPVAGVKEGDYVLLAYLDGDEDKTWWIQNYVDTDGYIFFKTTRTFLSTESMTFIIARTL